MADMRKSDKPGRSKLTGAVVKLWREQMGWSQREAAIALGCARNSLAGWESGRHNIPVYIGLAMSALALDMRPYGQAA